MAKSWPKMAKIRVSKVSFNSLYTLWVYRSCIYILICSQKLSAQISCGFKIVVKCRGANIDCPTAHNHLMCILPVKFQNVGQFVQLPAVAETTHGQQLKELPVTALKHKLSGSIDTHAPFL